MIETLLNGWCRVWGLKSCAAASPVDAALATVAGIMIVAVAIHLGGRIIRVAGGVAPIGGGRRRMLRGHDLSQPLPPDASWSERPETRGRKPIVLR